MDAAGNLVWAGYTFSEDLPTVAALQPLSGGSADGFVAKLDGASTSLIYATYLGGGGFDVVDAVSSDESGNAYVTGSGGSDFPLVNAFTSEGNAFVSKLDPAGSALVFSTFMGAGSSQDIAVDPGGNVYVVGEVSMGVGELPAVRALQGFCNQCEYETTDLFVKKIDATGSALVYSTYLGGSSNDQGTAIAVDDVGSAYLVGYTQSEDFPTAQPLQPTGDWYWGQGFVAKIEDVEAEGLEFTASSYNVVHGATATISVRRTGSLIGDVTVDYRTEDGSARDGADYEAVSGTLSFVGGNGQEQSFTVPTVEKGQDVADMSVNLILSGPTGGAELGGQHSAILWILGSAQTEVLTQTFVVRDRLLPVGPNWEATETLSWLSLDATSGTGPSNVTATVDPTGLSPGDYSGIITVTGDTGNSPQSVQVHLTVIGH